MSGRAQAVVNRAPAWARPALQLTVRTVRAALADRIPGLAAEVAFYLVLSLPPLLLAVLGSVGYLGDLFGEAYAQNLRARLLEAAGAIFTADTVEGTIAPVVDTLLREGRADIASFGALLTFWSASRALNVLLITITITYDLPMQPAWQRRAKAFALTIGAVLGGLVLVPLLVLGPRIVEALVRPLGLDDAVRTAWEVAYWPTVMGLATLALALLYHYGTPWHTPWRRDLPGALLAMMVWLAGSAGLRAYAASTIEADVVYQQFAAPLVMLLWLYVLGFAVLLGAELNAEIERMWPTISEEEEPDQA